MPQQIQLRRGTASAWATTNPVLAAGEVGTETDTRKFKVGDGTTAWNSLTYASVNYRGAYSAGTTYYVNDIVASGGSAYICILTSTGNAVTNTTYWSVLAAKGTDGTNGTNGTNGTSFTWRGTWSSATAYVVNDVVALNGTTYISIQAGTNQNPATQTAYWSVMAAKGTDGAVSLAGAQTLSNKTMTSTKYVVSALGSISGTNTLDLAAASEFTATIAGATTFGFTNEPGANETQVTYLRLTNAGSTTINWPLNTRFAGGTAPTFTTSGVDLLAIKLDPVSLKMMIFVIGLDVK